MKKLVMVCIAIVLCTSLASAATVYARIEADKDLYLQGEAVNWTIYAWSSNTTENDGISLLSLDIGEQANGGPGETLSQAFITDPPPPYSLMDSHYDQAHGYSLLKRGTVGAAGVLAEVLAAQDNQFPFKNVGNDDVEHVLAKGSFTATILGAHTLDLAWRAANYWPDTGGNPVAFETLSTPGGDIFAVVPEPATLMLLGLGGIALLRRKS